MLLDYELQLEQQESARRELNQLMGGSLMSPYEIREQKRADRTETMAEDGHPFDEADPLVLADETSGGDPEEYKVIYQRIAIRRQPSTESKVIGTAEKGTKLVTFEWDATRNWRMIRHKLRGGFGSTVVAWVLVSHPNLGALVQSSSKVLEMDLTDNAQSALAAAVRDSANETPEGNVVRASQLEQVIEDFLALERAFWAQEKSKKRPLSELEILKGIKASESDDEVEMPRQSPEGYMYASLGDMEDGADHGGLQYEVVFSPNIQVRSQPNGSSKVLAEVASGSRLDTFGWDKRKKWRKLFVNMPDRRIIVAWALTEHPERGVMLKPTAG